MANDSDRLTAEFGEQRGHSELSAAFRFPGPAGLIVQGNASGALSFDDFKVGYDTNNDGTSNTLQVSDKFNSTDMAPTHDKQ